MIGYVRKFEGNTKRKSTMQVFINNNARLLSKQRKSIILRYFWKSANMNMKRQKWRTLLMMIQKKSLSDKSDNEADNDSDKYNK